MNPPPSIPFLPENAPFTAEQRAYLNGFLAGLFSRQDAVMVAAPPVAPALRQLTVLFASQTGNAENLAKRIAKAAGKCGFAPTVQDMASYATAQLSSETDLLVVASTYGEGEPPDSGKAFWAWLESDAAPALSQLRFSVCALGDTNYPQFCAFGKNLERRLSQLSGRCVHPRADCDVDYEETFGCWLEGALRVLEAAPASSSPAAQPILVATSGGAAANTPADSASNASTEYGRVRPFPSCLLQNRQLNAAGSAKDTRHFTLSLEGSGLTYKAGDALGIWPRNCPALVAEFLQHLQFSGEEIVPGRDGVQVPLQIALRDHYEITKINRPFVQAVAEKAAAERLRVLSGPDQNGEWTKFLWGRELIDLLLEHPAVRFSPEELVGLLKKLQPRLYSISSSPASNPAGVDLTVAIVRYQSLERLRKGVCSTFLAERVAPADEVPIFIQPNKSFRVPAEPDRSVIMIGPGTGIAPFRGFLQQRAAEGGRGKNWLFFGDQHAQTDFLYRDELSAWQQNGTLTRLDTAFSRDQPERIYVQHRMLEQANEFYAWLEQGAHVYVCGDASRMAKDVDKALHEVIARAHDGNTERAAEYVKDLQAQKRYVRDVY